MYEFCIKSRQKKTRVVYLKCSVQTQRNPQVYSRQCYASLGFPSGTGKSANHNKVYINKTLPHLLTFVPEPHQIFFYLFFFSNGGWFCITSKASMTAGSFVDILCYSVTAMFSRQPGIFSPLLPHLPFCNTVLVVKYISHSAPVSSQQYGNITQHPKMEIRLINRSDF